MLVAVKLADTLACCPMRYAVSAIGEFISPSDLTPSPRRLVDALANVVRFREAAAAAQRLGVELVQRAPVTGVERSGATIDALLTPRGRFVADVVIDATNAWSPRLARRDPSPCP